MSIKERVLLGLGAGCGAVLLLQACVPLRGAEVVRSFFVAATVLIFLWELPGRLLQPGRPAPERLLIGLVAASLLARGLSAVGMLNLYTSIIVIASFAILGLLRIRTPASDLGALLPRSGWEIAGLVAAVLVVLPPPVGMDAMAYHLALPMRALARGNFTNPYPQSYDLYLLLKEPADVFALALDPTGRAAALLNVIAIPILAASLARVARAAGADESGRRWAGAIGATAPLALVLTAHTKPDLFGWAAGLFAFAAYLDDDDRSAAGWASVAILSKLTNAFLVLPVAVAAILARARARDLRGTAICAALAGWPLLFFLGGHPFGRAVADFRSPHPLVSMIALFAIHIPATISVPIGPLALPFFVAGLARPLPRGGRWLLAVGLGLWLLSGSWARFAAPVVLAAAAAGTASLAVSSRPARILASALAVLSLAAGVRVVSLRMDTLGWLSGRIDDAHYRAPWQTTAPILEAARDAIPPGRPIVLFGEYRVFPLGRDARVEDYSERSAILDAVRTDALFIDCGGIRAQDAARGLTPPDPPEYWAHLRSFLATRKTLLRDDNGNAVYDLSRPADSAPLPSPIPIPRVAIREDVDVSF